MKIEYLIHPAIFVFVNDRANKGMVLSVMRAALEDGPGIRTTVFLKGCPLDCIWCHNPESKSKHQELAYFDERCTQCGECVEACPNDAHSISQGEHILERANCAVSGCCVDACHYNALEVTGEMKHAEEIMEIVLKDKAYYHASGGGMTISGGEPLMQTSFTKHLLELAKVHNIHTCLDTSGYAPSESILEVIPLTDLFLFDLKASGPEIHKDLTGASNKLILENLDLLYTNGASIEIRLPLVEGINDHQDHFENVRQLLAKYPELKAVTVMPYHNTGQGKCKRYGYTDRMKRIPSANEELIARWKSVFN